MEILVDLDEEDGVFAGRHPHRLQTLQHASSVAFRHAEDKRCARKRNGIVLTGNDDACSAHTMFAEVGFLTLVRLSF